MSEIKLNRRYPESRLEDVTDAYMRGFEVGLAMRADENAKLRELCRLFAEYIDQDRCEGCVCKSRCDNGEIDECWQLTEIRETAHELGVEVHA